MDKENNYYFHKESHQYFKSLEDYERFVKTFTKNAEWAIRNKSRYNVVPSVSRILNVVFPFTGGDLNIANLWLKKIEARNQILNQDTNYENIFNSLQELRKILDSDLERSQTLGSEAHDLIEQYLITKKNVKTTNPYYKSLREQVDLLFDNEKVEYISSEEVMLHKELDYAGTYDGLLKVNGEYTLIDFKTGTKVAFDKLKKVELQLSAYSLMILKNKNIRVKKHICINAFENPKNDFKVESMIIPLDPKIGKQKWKKALKIYKDMIQLKKG